MTDFYVDGKFGTNNNKGSATEPWGKINFATNHKNIKPGDKIIVRGGIYRETVEIGGPNSCNEAFSLEAAPGEKVYIKGSDELTDWIKETDNIYKYGQSWHHQPLWIPVDRTTFLTAICSYFPKYHEGSAENEQTKAITCFHDLLKEYNQKLQSPVAIANTAPVAPNRPKEHPDYIQYHKDLKAYEDALNTIYNKILETYDNAEKFIKEYRDRTLQKQLSKDIFNIVFSDQIFVNGTQLKQVFSKSELYANTFFIDVSNTSLYLKLTNNQSLQNKLVEASIRNSLLKLHVETRNIKIKGFNFQHACSTATANIYKPKGIPERHAIELSGSKCIFEENDVSYMNGVGLNLGGKSNTLRKNLIHHNGHIGIVAGWSPITETSDYHMLEENSTTYNGIRTGIGGYEHGGIKIGSGNGWKIIRHFSAHNHLHGIWFDTACKNNLIEASCFVGNYGCAIHFERTGDDGPNEVRDCLMIGNHVGIWMNKSHNLKVHHNIFFYNIIGVDLSPFYEKDDIEYASKNNSIHHNIIGNNALVNLFLRLNFDPNKIETELKIISNTNTLIDNNLYYRGDHSHYSDFMNKCIDGQWLSNCRDDLIQSWTTTWKFIEPIIKGKRQLYWSIVAGVGWTSVSVFQPVTKPCKDLVSWQQISGNLNFDKNSLETNPQFENSIASKFNLKYSSPAIPHTIGLQNSTICLKNIYESFKYEYDTGKLFLNKGSKIQIHIINDSNESESFRIYIFKASPINSTPAHDSLIVTLNSKNNWGYEYTIIKDGEYWIRIMVTSEYIIPNAVFDFKSSLLWPFFSVYKPISFYSPGDFSVYELQPKRRRIIS